MTDNVGNRNTSSMGFDDFEIFELNNEPQNNRVSDTNGFEEIIIEKINNLNSNKNETLSNALKGAKLEKTELNEVMKQHLQRTISAHKSETGSSIGRFFMGVFHAIKKLFKLSSDSSVREQERKMAQGNFNRDIQLPRLPEDKTPISINTDVLEKAIGLKTGDAKTNQWPEDIYPNNGPRLSDIKQNPELQDCWFLSSVSATLKTLGPDYIKGLIKPAQNGEGYYVRISNEIVHVPKQITSKSGQVCFSDSQPWVQILETAMQIHKVKTYQNYVSEHHDEKSLKEISASLIPNMAYDNALNGMRALMGDTFDSSKPLTNSLLEQQMIVGGDKSQEFKNAYKYNHVMVLGSNGYSASFRDGISPGHAVAVLDYNEQSQKVTVLDPYGHTRVLSMDSVNKNYSLMTLGFKLPNN